MLKKLGYLLVAFVVVIIGLHFSLPQDIGIKAASAEHINRFNHLPYYQESFLDRYQQYDSQQLTLSYQDVVWRVNANLDQPMYENPQEINDFSNIIVVNKYNYLPKDYVPTDLVAGNNNKLMRKDTASSFNKMVQDARKLGLNLYAISAYRSYDYQQQLYSQYTRVHGSLQADTFSARPGFSEHQLGEAIDVVNSSFNLSSFGASKEGQWVAQHAHEYGYIVRYQEDIVDATGYIAEPWHLRFIGVDVATDMKAKNITILEEYLIKYPQK